MDDVVIPVLNCTALVMLGASFLCEKIYSLFKPSE